MKRFHVHIAVEKLDDSIRFYSSLFGVAPTVVQPDYAKWMLEDPRVNFAISQREASPASITWVFRWRAMPNCKPCAGNWQRQIQAWSNKPGLPVAMPLGQVLGDGPAGRGLGDLSYPRYDTDVWRGHTHLCHAECVLYPAAAI